jgi:hypothetical protein
MASAAVSEQNARPQYVLAEQPTTRQSAPSRSTQGSTDSQGTSRGPTQPRGQPGQSATPNANSLSPAPQQYTSLDSSNFSNSSSSYSLASTPNMIGDTLGLKFFLVNKDAAGGGKLLGQVPLAAGDSSVKIGEDTSPIPTDRVFFDYNFFSNPVISADGSAVDINRYTFGLEKTFFDGTCSFELKVPVISGLNNVQDPAATTADNEGTNLGLLALTTKALLYRDDQSAMSLGLAIGLPTAPDAELQFTPDVRVFDDSVHLAPFLGLLLTPNDRVFSITYLQLNFDCNGNHVTQGDTPIGRLRDPNLLYVDSTLGYWLFKDSPDGALGGYLTGLAPLIEIHYTTTLQDMEGVDSVIQPLSKRLDILNLTAGLYFQLGPLSSLVVAGVAPLRTSEADKEFDAEVLVQFNRRF